MRALFFFQLLSYAEAADYSARYEYDSLRRLVKVISPDNSTVKNIYNAYGQIILVERYSPAQILIQKTKTDYSLTGQPYKTYGSECFNYPSGSVNLSKTGAALSLPPSMTLLTVLISSQMGKDARLKRSIIQMGSPIRSSKLTAHLCSRIMPPIATALMVKLRPSWTQTGM